MFDVQDVSRFYRCSISDVHVGRSLLPADRVNDAPPFTYCAVDMFGPFIIKEGRKELKRYGCLFTCMACRAIHIETTNSLDTSFLLMHSGDLLHVEEVSGNCVQITALTSLELSVS